MSGRGYKLFACPACEEEGHIDEMLPVRGNDIEPRFRTVACEMCGGRGQIEVDGETHKILEAEAERLHKQLDSERALKTSAYETVRHQREQLIQAEAREHALRARLRELELAMERRAS